MSKTRRVDIKSILTTPHLRRTLMIDTLRATQAREGINTTQEQAERAYNKVVNERKVLIK